MFNLIELQQLTPQDTSPEYRRQQEIIGGYLNRLGRGFSADYLEDFQIELGRLVALARDQAFLSGLRLGSELTLALWQPLPKKPRP